MSPEKRPSEFLHLQHLLSQAHTEADRLVDSFPRGSWHLATARSFRADLEDVLGRLREETE